jgi:hypothetical protein
MINIDGICPACGRDYSNDPAMAGKPCPSDDCPSAGANTNVLQGMRCPECGSLGPFRIEIITTALVFDSGVEDMGDNEWDNESACECIECGYDGIVRDYRDIPRG